jgi:hypothetical protein
MLSRFIDATGGLGNWIAPLMAMSFFAGVYLMLFLYH